MYLNVVLSADMFDLNDFQVNYDFLIVLFFVHLFPIKKTTVFLQRFSQESRVFFVNFIKLNKFQIFLEGTGYSF